MLLNKITLENIGAYKGMNTFDFSIKSSSKNIIIIGGENGAGKTTLLNSIKVGLFGAFAYGYKTENDAYINKIKELLNRTALKEYNSNYQIKIQYSEIENLKKSEYIFIRKWKVTSKRIYESLDIFRDDQHLNQNDQDIYQTKLRELMPPQLFDLCLFDGEEVSSIINNKLLPQYIKKISKILFNLNLFDSLEQDLEQYMNNHLDQSKLTSTDKELLQLKNDKKNIETEIQSISNKSQNIDNLIFQTEEDTIQLKKEFRMNGGLLKKERDQFLKEITNIESERKYNATLIKDFISFLLPFYIDQELLQKTREQLNKEESLTSFEILNKRLDTQILNNVFRSFSGIKMNEVTIHSFRDKLLSSIKPAGITYLHKASFSERSQVNTLFEKIYNEDKNKYCLLLKENKEKLVKTQELKKKISLNDNVNDLTVLMDKIEKKNNELNEYKHIAEELKKKLKNLEEHLAEKTEQIIKLENILFSYEKSKNSFVLSQKVIDLTKRFRMNQQQKKLQEVEFESTKMLKSLLRKKQYIGSIKIDRISFEISLFSSNSSQLSILNLSAGEKELLLLSLMWAFFKCSGRKVPFIFDTLLGRLDNAHRKAVLTKYLPECGSQVLLLVTNSDINLSNYEILRDYLSHEYTLEFNTSNSSTSIKDRFFEEISI